VAKHRATVDDRKWLHSAVIAAFVLAAIAAAPAPATLLVNGNLDDPPDPESDVATGWTLVEGPGGANAATFASFGNHTPGGERGLWLRSFAGGFGPGAPATVSADLLQQVPGNPGWRYDLSAWSRWEEFYSGAVTNLNQGDATDTDDGPASPTETILAIDFLDAANVLLASTELDLRFLQSNDSTWRRHELSGIAPAGTAFVRARASMIDGILNPGVNPQSAFFDDFELIGVPEPGTLGAVALGIAGIAALRRRRAG
jgi:hypothetical protein